MSTNDNKTTITLELTNREANQVRQASFDHQPSMSIRQAIVRADHKYYPTAEEKADTWVLDLTDGEALFLINNCKSRAVVRALKKVI